MKSAALALSHTEALSPVYQRVNRFLGGRAVFGRPIKGIADAHALILRGMPTKAMVVLMREMPSIPATSVLGIVGISQRNWARRREAAEQDPKATLTVEEGNRLWKFTEILAQAATTLGSEAAAQEWMNKPQIGLDGKRPLELLTTAPGAQLVEDLLQRMEYGVYT